MKSTLLEFDDAILKALLMNIYRSWSPSHHCKPSLGYPPPSSPSHKLLPSGAMKCLSFTRVAGLPVVGVVENMHAIHVVKSRMCSLLVGARRWHNVRRQCNLLPCWSPPPITPGNHLPLSFSIDSFEFNFNLLGRRFSCPRTNDLRVHIVPPLWQIY